jgi:hypothetical protein
MAQSDEGHLQTGTCLRMPSRGLDFVLDFKHTQTQRVCVTM